MKTVASVLWPNLRVLQIYGANTGVGKTIFSSVLCRAFKNRLNDVYYLKPISTGPLDEADDRHISAFGAGVRTKCLFQFDEPVSPHIAARLAGNHISDEAVATAVYDELRLYTKTRDGISIVETAGGVLSPSPSGSSQADLYRPLRLPTVLVGDHQLGGIGTTISAWESLKIRGYDIESVALFSESRYDNHNYLKEYFAERGIHVFSIPPPPDRQKSAEADVKAMEHYYTRSSRRPELLAFTERFLANHEQRIDKLKAMPQEADEVIWHPFLQHTERSEETIIAWDSAYGDYFQSYTIKREPITQGDSVLKPAFDGSASWWTQCLGHGNPQLALNAAYAAGRYGHVMFGGAVHEPALRLAQTLVKNSGNPRLRKVFYSDNGSTGMEVAVKMALRATSLRRRWAQKRGGAIQILGLKNSYHGDTIGTMDCSEPSIFNEKVEWYKGRGLWLDFPTVKMRRGKWQVEAIASEDGSVAAATQTTDFESLSHVFNFEARQADAERYRDIIHKELSKQPGELRLGALIIEPIILGAGGMMFADPLYQRCLVEVARNYHDSTITNESKGPYRHNDPLRQADAEWHGMPVIFDEVFTGLYRLGRFSAASFLGVHPDIVVNAKLLTGGLLPLCTTTASDSIFDAFLSDDKTDALLHGHSYTAHPVGCSVANESLKQLANLDHGSAWQTFREDWSATSSSRQTNPQSNDKTWSMWSHSFLSSVSHLETVDHVFALGSVLAISLKDPQGSGYASTAATGLRDKMLAGNGGDEAVVHSRVLGNVLYLMAALTTTQQTLAELEQTVLAALR